MSEELPDLTVKVKSDVSDAVDGLAEVEAAEKSLGEQSDKTTAKVKQNQKDQGTASSDFKRLVVANMKDGETATQSMSRAIDDQKKKILDLRKTLAKSDNAGSVGIFGDLKKQQDDLKKLVQFAEAAGTQAKKDAGGGSMLDELGLLPKLAIGLGPLLVPAAAGSVLAVLAGGGLAAGIAGQFKSPQVQRAFTQFKSDAKSAFSDATSDFSIDTAHGLTVLDKGLTGFLGDLKPAFKALSPELSVIAKDVSNGLAKAGPNFANAMIKSKPALDALGYTVETLLDDSGKFFSGLSIGAAGGAVAIHELTDDVGTLVVAVGQGLGGIAALYGKLDQAQAKVDATVNSGTGFWGNLGQAAWSAAKNTLNPIGGGIDAVKNLTGMIGGASDAQGDLNTATSGYVNPAQMAANAAHNEATALKGVTDAIQAQAQAINATKDADLAAHVAHTNLIDAIKKGKVSWDENTDAGQKFIGLLYQANDANLAYFGTITNKTPGAIQNFLKQEQSLAKVAKAAGAPKKELQGIYDEIALLEAKLAELSKKKYSFVVNGKVVLSGTQHAKTLGGGAVASVFANSGVNYANSGVAGLTPHYDATGIYAGGPQPLYRFAEKSVKREALIAENGDSNRAMAALRTAASWRGQEVVPAGSRGAAHGGDIYVQAVFQVDGTTVATQLIGPVQRLISRSGVSVYGAKS